MASQSWVESSLRRSASLGLEVLERASRRSVDWTSTGASQTPTTTDEDAQTPVTSTHQELNDVFATIAEFMEQTTYQCKKFYQSGCCTERTDNERSHVSRFHTGTASGMSTPALPTRRHVRAPYNQAHASAADEDFFIEVSPGTYSITASTPESEQQTQTVSVKAGESVNLTFNL